MANCYLAIRGLQLGRALVNINRSRFWLKGKSWWWQMAKTRVSNKSRSNNLVIAVMILDDSWWFLRFACVVAVILTAMSKTRDQRWTWWVRYQGQGTTLEQSGCMARGRGTSWRCISIGCDRWRLRWKVDPQRFAVVKPLLLVLKSIGTSSSIADFVDVWITIWGFITW